MTPVPSHEPLQQRIYRALAAALRGGMAAYGWALGLLAVGVLVVGTLEPTVTRAYLEGSIGLGGGGGVLFGFHLLGLALELFKVQAGSWSYPEPAWAEVETAGSAQSPTRQSIPR